MRVEIPDPGDAFERLQTLTEALAGALSTTEVCDLVAREGTRALCATGCAVMLVDRAHANLELCGARGLSPAALDCAQRVGLGDHHPIADAVRGSVALFLAAGDGTHLDRREGAAVTLDESGPRLAVAFAAGGRAIGGAGFAFHKGQKLDAATRVLAEALGRHGALALDRCARFDEASAAHARLVSLKRITAQLASVVSFDATARMLIDAALEALGCPAGWLGVLTDDGEALSLLAARGKSIDLNEWRRFPMSTPGPLIDGIRTGRMRCFESAEAYVAAYPSLAREVHLEGYQAAAIVPLELHGRTHGTLGLRFRGTMELDDELRRFLAAIGQQGGLALERARLFDATHAARDRLSLEVDVLRALQRRPSAERACALVAEAAVAAHADWCAAWLVGDDGVPALQAFSSRHPASAGIEAALHNDRRAWADAAVRSVVATGRSETLVHDDGAPWASERGATTRALPLVAEGTALGAVLVGARPPPRRASFDFPLVEDIAAHAARAVAAHHSSNMR